MRSLARRRDMLEISERLQGLRADTPARWGRMSAHQTVCHLSDCCRMATGEKVIAAEPRLIERTIVKWIALYMPFRWPAGVPTRPETDQEAGGTRPGDFAADLEELQRLVERAAVKTRRAPTSHPVFGRMSQGDWLRWGYLHLDHHLRQFGR